MDLPEEAKRAPSAPVWNQSFPSLCGKNAELFCWENASFACTPVDVLISEHYQRSSSFANGRTSLPSITLDDAVTMWSHIGLCAGLKELGELLLTKFKWGKTFFDVNRDILDSYAACETSTDVVAAQKHHLEELEKADRTRHDRGTVVCKLSSFDKQRSLITCLENLEMSGNLTAVREMSGILLKIREVAGKKSCQGKVA